MKRSLFVTGAGGYVGSYLLRAVPPDRYERVYCLGRREPAPGTPGYLEWIRADLLEPARYQKGLAACDTVVHLAAATGKNRPEAFFRVNRDGTAALVEACRQSSTRKFLHVSTIAVKFPDLSRYPYAESKKQAEEIVRQSGLPFTILRPTIITGPRAPVLEGIFRLAGAPIVPVFGGGRTLVQPVYVEDLIAVIVGFLNGGAFENRTIDVGGPETLGMEEFLLKARAIRSGKPPRILHLPGRMWIPLLGFLEKFLLPVMPVTAGQLTSFTSDGTAEESPLLTEWHGGMKGIDEVLRLATKQ